VVSITTEELRAAEEDAPLEDFPAWQHDAMRIAAVVWLCSDAASFVTGHTMTVDGGHVAQPTMNGATWRVTQGIIGVRGAVPLVEELATAEDVQSFVCGHMRWSDGTPGPAVELEDEVQCWRSIRCRRQGCQQHAGVGMLRACENRLDRAGVLTG